MCVEYDPPLCQHKKGSGHKVHVSSASGSTGHSAGGCRRAHHNGKPTERKELRTRREGGRWRTREEGNGVGERKFSHMPTHNCGDKLTWHIKRGRVSFVEREANASNDVMAQAHTA